MSTRRFIAGCAGTAVGIGMVVVPPVDAAPKVLGPPNGGIPLSVGLQAPAELLTQTAEVHLPARIKPKGTTVLMRKTVLTNAGQPVWTTPRWSTKRSANGHKAKYASANVTNSGRLTITTTGKAKTLYVKLHMYALATEGYTAYSETKRWTVK